MAPAEAGDETMIPTYDPDTSIDENGNPEDIFGYVPDDAWYVRERLREDEERKRNQQRDS